MAHWTFLWLALLAPPDATEPSEHEQPVEQPVEPLSAEAPEEPPP